MSKERELLERWVDDRILEPEELDSLMKETKELLAQPEQTEQEPVGSVKTIGGYPDQSEHTVELTCRHRDLKDGDLLYKAPPKRELLGDGITADMYRANKKATHPDSYWAGVYDAEKAHGIGGGE